jgi:hypothetical protein
MIKKLFSRFSGPKEAQQFITVVSGLPRSGTSMMMQILAAGGLPVVTDEQRTADDDNPKGYYELERVKALKQGDTAWLDQAGGKCVKVISYLLQSLPPTYSYKVIFMQREMAEVLASQKQMLIRRGEPTDKTSDAVMASYFERHLAEVEAWLAKQKNFQVCTIPYAGLLEQPQQHIQQVIAFLGLALDEEAMLGVPDQNLHRQRRSQA